MKKNKFKGISAISTIVIMLLLLPVIAFAQAVPWITEQYTAVVEYEYNNYYGYDSATGTSASLPIIASLDENQAVLTSSITSSRMEVSQDFTGSGPGIYGLILLVDAYFHGTYLAAEQYFVFSYARPDDSIFGATLYVRDISDSNSILYSGYLYGSPVNIATPTGHMIDVSVHLWTEGPPSSSTYLDYSMSTAVVPEPISSTLFIVGAATLGFRRFRKKFKK